MKWLKHDSTARNDVKLKMLRKKFGAEGYGVYFMLLEIIAEYAQENNLDEWGYVDRFHDTETLADDIGVTPEYLKKFLEECNRLELFEKKNHRLYCGKILKRLDDYAQRLLRKNTKTNGLRTNYEQSSARVEKKRKEKSRVEAAPEQSSDKPCHNTLTSCDDYCTWQIGIDLDTHKRNVDDVREKLERYIKKHPKKYSEFHDTLITWVRGDLEKGAIEHMNEIEVMDMPSEHPDKVKDLRRRARILAEKGVI